VTENRGNFATRKTAFRTSSCCDAKVWIAKIQTFQSSGGPSQLVSQTWKFLNCGSEIQLKMFNVFSGRAPQCTITLKSKRVSRNQCEIIVRNDRICVRDNQVSWNY
jgi:hypothetical protein